MAKLLVLLAACATATNAKIFVFKADQCNTNFNDASNWQNLEDDSGPINPMEGVPSQISFGDLDGVESAVDVAVNSGDYNMGSIEMQDTMVLTLDDDVSLFISGEEAEGPKARFVAGQSTDKAACSVGCNTNFFVFDGNKKDAAAVDIKGAAENAALADADAVPCSDDTVVIPAGYNVNMLAMGFHTFRSVVYQAGDELVEAKQTSQMPEFSLFPAANMRVFFGDDAIDQCQERGMMNADDNCVCASECPAADAVALAEANQIRMAAKAHGTRQLAKYKKGDELDVDYTYAEAFPADVQVADADAWRNCEISGKTFKAGLSKYFNDQVRVLSVRLSVDTEARTATFEGTAEATGGHLRGQAGSFDGPVKIGTSDADANFAMGIYATIIDSLQADCGLGRSAGAAALKAAGVEEVSEELSVVFGGSNLPQIDVNRLVDPNNREGVVAATHKALRYAQGWTGLNKDAMLAEWRLAGPEEVHKARRAAPPRLGLATSLVHVKLEYSRWSTGAGINKAAVRDVVNWVFATYDTKTHHRCFTFAAGFDDQCITDIVADIIKNEVGACANKDAEQCRQAAFDKALEQIMAIKGCGLLGSTGTGADQKCIDPEDEKRVRAEATTTADAAVAAAVATNLKAHVDAVTAFNATRNAKIAAQSGETAAAATKAQADARAAAAGKDQAAVQSLFTAAEADLATKAAALATATRGYDKCMERSTDDNATATACGPEETALFEATRDHAVADATVQTLKVDLELKNLTPEEAAKKQKEAADEAEKVAKALVEQQASINDKKRAYEKCEADQTAADCASLKTELDALTVDLLILQAKLKALNAYNPPAAATLAAGSAGTAAPAAGDDSGGVIVVAMIIGCVLILGIIVAVVVVLKGGNGKAVPPGGDRGAGTAFANPMYQDPSAGAGAQGSLAASSYLSGKSSAAPAAPAADAENGGLYDEPAFQDQGVDKANPMYESAAAESGYLDVEPDDDDGGDSEEDE